MVGRRRSQRLPSPSPRSIDQRRFTDTVGVITVSSAGSLDLPLLVPNQPLTLETVPQPGAMAIARARMRTRRCMESGLRARRGLAAGFDEFELDQAAHRRGLVQDGHGLFVGLAR